MKKKKQRPNPKPSEDLKLLERKLRLIDEQYLPLILMALKNKDTETVAFLLNRRQQEIYMTKAGVL